MKKEGRAEDKITFWVRKNRQRLAWEVSPGKVRLRKCEGSCLKVPETSLFFEQQASCQVLGMLRKEEAREQRVGSSP